MATCLGCAVYSRSVYCFVATATLDNTKQKVVREKERERVLRGNKN